MCRALGGGGYELRRQNTVSQTPFSSMIFSNIPEFLISIPEFKSETPLKESSFLTPLFQADSEEIKTKSDQLTEGIPGVLYSFVRSISRFFESPSNPKIKITEEAEEDSSKEDRIYKRRD